MSAWLSFTATLSISDRYSMWNEQFPCCLANSAMYVFVADALYKANTSSFDLSYIRIAVRVFQIPLTLPVETPARLSLEIRTTLKATRWTMCSYRF